MKRERFQIHLEDSIILILKVHKDIAQKEKRRHGEHQCRSHQQNLNKPNLIKRQMDHASSSIWIYSRNTRMIQQPQSSLFTSLTLST